MSLLLETLPSSLGLLEVSFNDTASDVPYWPTTMRDDEALVGWLDHRQINSTQRYFRLIYKEWYSYNLWRQSVAVLMTALMYINILKMLNLQREQRSLTLVVTSAAVNQTLVEGRFPDGSRSLKWFSLAHFDIKISSRYTNAKYCFEQNVQLSMILICPHRLCRQLWSDVASYRVDSLHFHHWWSSNLSACVTSGTPCYSWWLAWVIQHYFSKHRVH